MNYILAAILSNLSFAVGDNFNGILARHNSPLRQALWASLLGTVIMLPAVFFFPQEIARLTPVNVLLLLGTSAIASAGYICFITGMNKGNVTLTGVISNSFPVVATLFALIFFGEHVSGWQGLAIALAITGVLLSSLQGHPRAMFRNITGTTLVYAFGAFLLWGIYFAIVRIPIERVGWFTTQYANNIFAVPMYILLAWRVKDRTVWRVPKLPWLLVAVEIIISVGALLFFYSISKGSTAIVVPIAGSSPAVFAILAFFIFKEKLTRLQIVGIIAALAGVIWLSVLSG